MHNDAIVVSGEVVGAEVLDHIVQNKESKLQTLLHTTFESLVQNSCSERVDKFSNHV